MTTQPYSHAWEHYADALRLLDKQLQLLYLRRQVQTPDPQTDAFRGMFVSEDEFMRLIGKAGSELDAPEEDELLQEIESWQLHIAQRLAASRQTTVFLPLPYLAARFGLSPSEERIVLLALAPELDRKYERIFGFLQDDLTNKAPNVSLTLQLSCSTPEEMRAARIVFTPEGKLVRYLLHKEEHEPGFRSLLSKPVVLDKRIVAFLLDTGELDPGLKPAVDIAYPDDGLQPLYIHEDFQQRLREFIRASYEGNDRRRLAFFLWGASGAGKQLHVRHCCSVFNKPLLLVDLSLLPADNMAFHERLKAVLREAILHQAVLCFNRLEMLYPEEPDALSERRLQLFHEQLDAYGGLLFLLAGQHLRLAWKQKSRLVVEYELKAPDEAAREQLWTLCAEELGVAAELDWSIVAAKFRFTPGQIRRALTQAVGYSAWQRTEAAPNGQQLYGLQSAALYRACYQQVQHRLERKATRIEPRYGWEDVILPPEQKDQLRNACNQVKYRGVVYGEWGFEKKLAYGKGLSMLFAGPPGTGKTMSAQVVAGELQLELYKIDLSQVISKYIGETEKNLHEIFQEAQLSNAVLFFDETDALFGKRSEVKDSHDKYANVETAYLLQKMEEYQGITVLATNLLNNIDEAFLRRINYIIKYPFPDPEYREKIWRSMFPPAAPLSDDVDFKYLAQKFEIAGGNIKNVVLSAAFLAAESGESIGMRHLIGSIRHELQKSGKIVARHDWETY